jgi:predicted transcriptional regulator
MPRMIGDGLSRREREMMEILHRLGRAAVGEVREALPDPPSYSSVRSILRILEEKGHVKHIEEGKRFLFSPTEASQSAAKSALRGVLKTFFGGSLEAAVKTFLTDQEADLSADELARLADMISQARDEESKEDPK